MDFPPDVLGAAMLSFYGGRAECRIRNTMLPVVYCDFLSMYPTVNTLLGNWRLLTAARIDVVQTTLAVQRLLNRVTADDLLLPRLWKLLPVFAQIKPEGDLLPVRADYGTGGWNIGVNYVHSSKSLWYALPDLIASKLLGQRIPNIIRAIQLVPQGRVSGLSPIELAGEMTVNPNDEDFFRAVIQMRKRAGQGSASDLALKILANAGAYGVFAERNRQELAMGKRERVTVWGLDGPFDIEVDTPETLGRYSFPPLAALITAGARLMLALAEYEVGRLGGSYLMCDTDSMAIVATEEGGLLECLGGPERLPDGREAVRALSWAEVDQVRERFLALNPYKRNVVPGSVLELEHENLDRESKHRKQLYGYAISSKRYALFNLDRDHLIIRKRSEHGLGHLLNPTDPIREALDTPLADLDEAEGKTSEETPVTTLARRHKRWVDEAWEYIVRTDGLGQVVAEPEWLDRPAVTRVTVGTPAYLRHFDEFNHGFVRPRDRRQLRRQLAAAEMEAAASQHSWKEFLTSLSESGGVRAGEDLAGGLPSGMIKDNGRTLAELATDLGFESANALSAECRSLRDSSRQARLRLRQLRKLPDLDARPYAEQIKPYNFLLGAHVAHGTFGVPYGIDPANVRLVAPFETDPDRWLGMLWTNLHDDHPYRVAVRTEEGNLIPPAGTIYIKTMRDVIHGYRRHPEHKSLAPDGFSCQPETRGLLRRRQVRVAQVRYIGKEGNRLDERVRGMLSSRDQYLNEYHDPSENLWHTHVLPTLKDIRTRRLAELSKVPERTIQAIKAGREPTLHTRQALTGAAIDFVRKQLQDSDATVPNMDSGVLSAHLNARSSRRDPTCLSCRRALSGRQRRFCSDACRKRASRRPPERP